MTTAYRRCRLILTYLTVGHLAGALDSTAQNLSYHAIVENTQLHSQALSASGGNSSNTSWNVTAVVAAGSPPGPSSNASHILHAGFLNTFIQFPNIDTDANGIADENDPDDDQDGLNDLDELAGTRFAPFTFTNPLIADSDGDKILDGNEAIAGTNPLDQNSGLYILPPKRVANQDIVTWQSRQGLTYNILYATSASELINNPQILQTVTVNSGGTGPFLETMASVTNQHPAARTLYRIEMQP